MENMFFTNKTKANKLDTIKELIAASEFCYDLMSRYAGNGPMSDEWLIDGIFFAFKNRDQAQIKTLNCVTCALGWDFLATIGVSTEKYSVNAKNMYAEALTHYLDDKNVFDEIQQFYKNSVIHAKNTYLSKLHGILYRLWYDLGSTTLEETRSFLQELKENIIDLSEPYKSAAQQFLEETNHIPLQEWISSPGKLYDPATKFYTVFQQTDFDMEDELMLQMSRLQVDNELVHLGLSLGNRRNRLLHDLLIAENPFTFIRALISTLDDITPQRLNDPKRDLDEDLSSNVEMMQIFERRIVKAKRKIAETPVSSSAPAPDAYKEDLELLDADSSSSPEKRCKR